MRILILIIALLNISNIFAKDRLECKAMYGSIRNIPKITKKVKKALNETIKKSDKVKDLSISTDGNGSVIICVVIEEQ